jgi:dynein heavy chain
VHVRFKYKYRIPFVCTIKNFTYSNPRRVFCDRLINKKDKRLVDEFIEEIIEDRFEHQADYALKNPILFGDYRNALEEDAVRVYEDIIDYDAAKALFHELMDDYNENNKNMKMDLVLFDYALEHLTRIHRAIRMHKGHCLLIGVGGNGRQSLTRLASHTAGYKLFEIHLNRGYAEYHFREDLKRLYNELGILNKEMTFLFSETQIAEEGFLELINNMLTVGIVPALFSDEERDNIIENLRAEAKKATGAITKEAIWQFFIQKCVNNLHVVLTMSPTGDFLRNRCRNFPGLVGNTYIDWFHGWPKQALYAVATIFFHQVIN